MAVINDGKTITLTSQGAIAITEEALSSSTAMYFRATIPAVYRTDIVQIGLLGSEGNKSIYLTLSNTSGSIDYEKSYVSVTIESQVSNDSDTAIGIAGSGLELYNTGDTISILVDNSYVVVTLNNIEIAKGYVDFELDPSYRFFAEYSLSENAQTYLISNVLFYPVGSIGTSVGITSLISNPLVEGEPEKTHKHLITPNTHRFYSGDTLESIDTLNANEFGIYLSFLLKQASNRITSSENIFNDRIRFGLKDPISGTYFHFYLRQLEFPGYADFLIYKDNEDRRLFGETIVWPATFSMLCDTANITFVVNGVVKWTEYIPENSRYHLFALTDFQQNAQIPRYYEATDIIFHPTGRVGSLGPQGATGPAGPTGSTGSVGVSGTSTTLVTLKRLTAISKTGFEILLSSNATLSVNDPVEFTEIVGNVPANRVFYVRTKVGIDRITIKTTIGATSPY